MTSEEKEILLPINGFENYRASNLGYIYNTTRKGKTYPIKLKNILANGTLRVSLRKNGKTYQFPVTRLIAKCFVKNPLNYDNVKHLDENSLNNNAKNLYWTCNKKEPYEISENTITCARCLQTKYDSVFKESKNGKILFRNKCAECMYQIRKEKYGHKFSEYRTRQHFNEKTTLDGRASLMFYRCKRRSRVDKKDFNLSKDDILKLISYMKCSKTGIDLIIDANLNNPYAPSVDRIDNSKGYTLDNIQVVCSIYNYCKNQFSDEDVSNFMQLFYKNKFK